MVSALQIANDTSLSLGLGDVDTLVGGSDEGRVMLVHMNRGGQALLSQRGPFGQGWPSADKVYEFTTDGGRDFYPLPADFVTFIPGTIWDISLGWEAAGPLTPMEDSVVRFGHVGAAAIATLFRQQERDGQVGLTLYPDPGEGKVIHLEYISSSWVRSAEGQPPTLSAIAADAHVPIFPPHLVSLDLAWRMKKGLGQDFSVELGEFELERGRQFGQAHPPRTLRISGGDLDYAELSSTYAYTPVATR